MLIDLFVRIEGFFRRLESYTEVRPTAAMTNIIVKIMVEILTTLAIATKDIKQRRASELIPGVAVWPTLTYTCLEKYVKQLLGKNEIEGSLKRLDTLTQEEARMAIAEILRVTHSVNDNVRVVLNGAQDVIFLLFRLSLTRILPDGKDAKDVMQRTAHDVNEVKRWSHSDVTTVSGAQLLSQRRCRDRTFESGSPHRTPRQITTPSTVLNTRGRQPGSSRVVSTKNGSQRLPSCGFMGNVCPSFLLLLCRP